MTVAYRDALPPTPAAVLEAEQIRLRWGEHYLRPHRLHVVKDFGRQGLEVVENIERKRLLWILEERSGLCNGVGYGVYL